MVIKHGCQRWKRAGWGLPRASGAVAHPKPTNGHNWPPCMIFTVNGKDRQELADAALWPAVTDSVAGVAGARGAMSTSCQSSPAASGGQLWPCMASFCTSSEPIRNRTKRVRRELVAFHHGFQE